MHVVGPRPLSIGELDFRDPIVRARLDVVPGIVSLSGLRRRANMLFDPETVVDREYVERAAARSDIGVLVRLMLTAGLRCAGQEAPRFVDVLGLRIANITTQDAIDRIVARVQSRQSTPLTVGFVNAHYANIASTDATYRNALAEAELLLGDGIGIRLAGSILRTPLRENVNGTDLFPRLCGALPRGARVFLLGAAPGVADQVGVWMEQHYPHLTVCGTRDGYSDADDIGGLASSIRATVPDVVLVAMGAPRQEVVISALARQLDVGVLMGVGGLFDFFSGRIPRAPSWMRELGLEWVYRLGQEPGRMWQRYVVGNFAFLIRVARQRLHGPEECAV
jgi:N-acetylglucosaminyldiphosphoundecaprenol N-acetyl-beta-D-mannosaminyltransferase